MVDLLVAMMVVCLEARTVEPKVDWRAFQTVVMKVDLMVVQTVAALVYRMVGLLVNQRAVLMADYWVEWMVDQKELKMAALMADELAGLWVDKLETMLAV